MKKHVKLYHEHFLYQPGDWIGCEVCDTTAVDIHHIDPRGMGGSNSKDEPENLMALCRECHTMFGDKKKFKRMLKKMHHERVNDTIKSLRGN